MLAPFIKLPNLMRELAISQDIDPDSLVNDMNEAAIYAEMLKDYKMLNKEQAPEGGPTGQQPTGMGGVGGVPQRTCTN